METIPGSGISATFPFNNPSAIHFADQIIHKYNQQPSQPDKTFAQPGIYYLLFKVTFPMTIFGKNIYEKMMHFQPLSLCLFQHFL